MAERPQQEEIARSERTPIVQESREAKARDAQERLPEGNEYQPRGKGRVPPDNRPGHHPDVEQDKPDLDRDRD